MILFINIIFFYLYSMDNLSCLNIQPDKIKITENNHYYNYTFLNDIFDFQIKNYYNLILSLDTFKLKNLYNYLFLRSLKLKDKYNKIKEMKRNKYINCPSIMNEELVNYICKDKILSIIIMNGIQHYFNPKN
jgi:hypothetical protein